MKIRICELLKKYLGLTVIISAEMCIRDSTEAVQSGLETLRSHLELVRGDIALLYEMT